MTGRLSGSLDTELPESSSQCTLPSPSGTDTLFFSANYKQRDAFVGLPKPRGEVI